jgi:hypothetical protein
MNRLIIVSIMVFVGLVNSCNQNVSIKLNIDSYIKPLKLDRDKRLSYKNKVVYFDSVKGKVKSVNIDFYGVFPTEGNTNDTLIKVPGNCEKLSFSRNGNLIEKTNYFDDITYFTELYFYNSNNQLIKKLIVTPQAHLTDTINYLYDSTGLLRKQIKSFQTSVNKQEFEYTIYNYDSVGRLNEEINLMSSNPGFQIAYLYTYDKNNILPKSKTDANNKSDYHLYCYDKSGHIISEVQAGKNIMNPDSILYYYNPNGDLVEDKSTSPQNSVTYKYEYDSIGNWIKKTEFCNGTKLSVKVRTIQYY